MFFSLQFDYNNFFVPSSGSGVFKQNVLIDESQKIRKGYKVWSNFTYTVRTEHVGFRPAYTSLHRTEYSST